MSDIENFLFETSSPNKVFNRGLEKELTMGWLNKKNTNGIADAAEHLETGGMNRRDFIKKGALLTAAVAADLTIPDFSFASQNPKEILKRLKQTKYTKTELFHLNQQKNNWEKLPPGYANCRDYILDLIYGDEVGNIWNLGGNYALLERLTRKTGIKGEQVLWQTQYLEPAFYFFKEKQSKSNHYSSDDTLREVNLPLEFFKEGLQDYFTQWHRSHLPMGRGTTPKRIEEGFLKSIFAAAYMREDLAVKETQNFLQLTSMQEKAKKLTKTMNIFKSLSKDVTSADPEDGYNRCLVAAWSSYMLTRNSQNLEGKGTTTMLYYNNLEILSRKNLGYPIRGPPHMDA